MTHWPLKTEGTSQGEEARDGGKSYRCEDVLSARTSARSQCMLYIGDLVANLRAQTD